MQPIGLSKRDTLIGSFDSASLDSATTPEDTAPIAPSFSLTIEAEHNSDIIMSSAVFSSLTCLTRPDLNLKLFPP